jgi:hypothetical protein
VTEDPGAATDQPDAKTTADRPKKSARIERPGQNENQDMAGALPTIAAAQPAASTGTTEQEEPPGKLEGAVVPSIAPASSTATGAAERGDVAGNTENGPAPSLPRSGIEVAKVTEDPGAATDQPDAKTTADRPKKSARIERPGQNLNRARSAEVELSLERDKNASQSFSSDHPTAGDNAIGNAADTRSTDPKFYRDRGMAFYRNGDLDRALADFDAAIQLDPVSEGGSSSEEALAVHHARNLAQARNLQRAQPAAHQRFGVLKAVALVVEFEARPQIRVQSVGFGPFVLAVGPRLRGEQRTKLAYFGFGVSLRRQAGVIFDIGPYQHGRAAGKREPARQRG